MSLFRPFQKIPRFFRDVVITEKIDGTNAQVYIHDLSVDNTFEEKDLDRIVADVGDYLVFAGSRKRLIVPGDDNAGFASWVKEHAETLVRLLGPGQHFGEWYGQGIQRRYGLDHKRFALFNTSRWAHLGDVTAREANDVPATLGIVPVLYTGPFTGVEVQETARRLRIYGSQAVPGFANPEGLILYHSSSRLLFKYTLDGDGHKGER